MSDDLELSRLTALWQRWDIQPGSDLTTRDLTVAMKEAADRRGTTGTALIEAITERRRAGDDQATAIRAVLG